MQFWKQCLLVLSICIALFHTELCPAEEPKAPPVTQPLAMVSGKESHIDKPTYRRVRSAEKWKQLWLDHLGEQNDTIYRPLMEVDFSRCEVVAVFAGTSKNTVSLRCVAIEEKTDAIELRFQSIGFQTMDHWVYSTPFAFFVVPRSDKRIVLQEGNPEFGSAPPRTWTEVARFPATD